MGLQPRAAQQRRTTPPRRACTCIVPCCSHRKKRMRQIKKMAQRGLLDPDKEDPFSLFVASTNIRYCYYAESASILGNTYGMAVLQVGGSA
jgi:tRNA(Met) C34 N-acetyltransferase TmcA